MRGRLTRAVTFRAHHRLYDAAQPPSANEADFGWTTEPHPHDYRVEVTVSAPLAERRPMVIDLARFDALLAEEVTGRLAGRRLDRDVPAFAETLPTCEGIARDLYHRLVARLPEGVQLDRVRVAEDATLAGEYGVD
ncbi:MAG: 6-carboxytetrahydropterin synthase [Gemmatimonadales bacterium]